MLKNEPIGLFPAFVTVLRHERFDGDPCPSCTRPIHAGDVVLKVYLGNDKNGLPRFIAIHRRCIEELLVDAPLDQVDAVIAQKREEILASLIVPFDPT